MSDEEAQRQMPIDDVIRALVEQYGRREVQAALNRYQSFSTPLPETVSLDEMRADPHQVQGRTKPIGSPDEEPSSSA